MHRSLFPLFFLFSILLTLFTPFMTTSIPLTFFAPYLILVLYKKRKSQALTQAFLCGSILDLLSASTTIGFWTLNYIVTLLLLGKIKHLFFTEKMSTLPLLSFFFSEISTAFHFTFTHIFCTKSHLSLHWIATDLVLLPLFDGLYGFVLFSIPIFFLSKWLPETKRQTSSLNLKES